jgi:hypothetical protein
MKPAALFQQLFAWSRPTIDAKPRDWQPAMRVVSHAVPAQYKERFVAAGYKPSSFFPHRIHYLPKCGPDGAFLAERMCGVRDLDRLWQIVMFAVPPNVDEFPSELFFDRDVVWHQQHFGHVGQVASANLVTRGDTLFTMVHQSDLVQRISRRRDLKTHVERVFKGWHHMLLHSILEFAADRGFREVRVPTSQLAMQHTDRKRRVRPELFERVYDRAVLHHVQAAREAGWWSIPVARSSGVVVPAERRQDVRVFGKTLCISHDIEHGLGHRDADVEFAKQADLESPAAVERMLDIERSTGVRATYCVVGCLLAEVRDRIEGDGHCLAFHSFDHVIAHDQLDRCRGVDYRIKGYRPPQSVLTPETGDDGLCRYNFEWLASAASSLGSAVPRLEHRLVHIPIVLDDFPLHTGRLSFENWRLKALDTIRQNDFVALSLHDCYASHWLPHYEPFLREVSTLARLRTMDEVAAELFLAAGV